MGNEVVSYYNDYPSELHLDVKEGECKTILFASLKEAKSLHISLNLSENAQIEMVFADLSTGKADIVVDAVLKGPGSRFSFHGASLSSSSSNKRFLISAEHESGATEALVENYGIVASSSRLTFSGTGKIDQGAKKSKTRQVAKIIVFDKDCFASASPILKIDENDVEASHASIEGRLNDDHLFYLQSRGVSREEARKLITYGYLKPIASYFPDGEKEKILDAIEGALA